MSTYENENNTLQKQIEQINEILNEIKDSQQKELTLLKNNHATTMKKMMKLQEYNEISDMTNKVFEKRLLGIEDAIHKSISVKNN